LVVPVRPGGGADDPRRIIEDDSIALVVSAPIPCDRATLGISVMRHGKDFMANAQIAMPRSFARDVWALFYAYFAPDFCTS
jgi:hypothetical protein